MIETESIKRLLVPGNFTFVVMTDRDDLDEQLYKTFVGCGAADEQTPRASSGRQLQTLLTENHRYVFSLIHKFNQDVHPDAPYSRRDDIIVISDEAYRTQAGKLARNMRLALPNASFIGFTGTPLFTYDHLIRRIFGGYVSRYDFRGFDRIAALRDATNAVYTSDEAKRRVELMARQVFARCKALLMEPAAFTSAERHDHIAAIDQKLQERRDTSDVTALLKELHQIVNEAIRTQETGTDHAEGLTVDLSQLDVQQWRDEFAQVKRTQVLRQDIRALVEQKLQ